MPPAIPTAIPTDRETVATLTADDLGALTAALATASSLVDDVRDERAPQSFCGQWGHSGHHWTRYARPRYCWGYGPGMDREAFGKCGARWPHPAHDLLGTWDTLCPGLPADGGDTETAQTIATRLLAAWGITAHCDEDAGNTWLVVGYDQNRQDFPRMLAAPYAVLYLYNDTDGEQITVTRPPGSGDDWRVLAGDGTGAERELMTRPADQLAECVEAIADWITTPQPSPDLLTQLADLRGQFKFGYTPQDVRSVFGRIRDAGGPYLVCVWEYADDYGFGGNSQFYAEDEAGDLFEVQPDIYRWLSGEQATPGAVDTWVCAPVSEPIEIAVSDDFHNYARSGDRQAADPTATGGITTA
jgi:hypothetical protein